MRVLVMWALGLFCISWLAFAVIDFNDDKDTLRVYQIKEVLDRTSSLSGDQLPKYSAEAVKEYRVSGDKIILKVGSFVDEYENCKIFDVESWSCTFSDQSATVGASNGVYFSRLNINKFPHLADPLYRSGITVSRARVVLNHCQWHLLGGFWGIFGCALTPFITD